MGGHSPGQLLGWLPPRAFLRVNTEERGPSRGALAPTLLDRGSQHRIRVRQAAAAKGQVRGAGHRSLSPRCELIIQMGCPGSGDWRPAPARRAISPATHVTAALVGSEVHTSSSSFSLHPTPAPVPRASRHLPAAPHCQPRPLPRSPRARRRQAAGAAGIGAPVWATSDPQPPPPATHASRPLPITASGQPREKEGVEPREREREGGRGQCLS